MSCNASNGGNTPPSMSRMYKPNHSTHPTWFPPLHLLQCMHLVCKPYSAPKRSKTRIQEIHINKEYAIRPRNINKEGNKCCPPQCKNNLYSKSFKMTDRPHHQMGGQKSRKEGHTPFRTKRHERKELAQSFKRQVRPPSLQLQATVWPGTSCLQNATWPLRTQAWGPPCMT